MQTRARAKRLGFLVAIIAVVAHAWVFSLVATHGPFRAIEAAAGSDGLVICTANGTRVLTVGADGQPQEGPTSPASAAHCDLCLPARLVAILGPNGQHEGEAPALRDGTLLPTPSASPSTRASTRPTRIRGPPHAV